MQKEQKLPKWFDGKVYEEGSVVKNKLTGKEYKLNSIELSMYDAVMGASIIAEMGGADTYSIGVLKRGVDWFRENNKEAYRILLEDLR